MKRTLIGLGLIAWWLTRRSAPTSTPAPADLTRGGLLTPSTDSASTDFTKVRADLGFRSPSLGITAAGLYRGRA